MPDILGTLNYYWPNTAIRYASNSASFPLGVTAIPCCGGYIELAQGASLPADSLIQAQFANYDALVAAAQSTASLVSSAMAALTKSDETMHRIQEAIALGLTTWTTADVVAWVNYRRALRQIIGTKTGSLPSKPSYPSGT